jgi:hypothetical protein
LENDIRNNYGDFMGDPESIVDICDELEEYGNQLTARTNSTKDGLVLAAAREIRRLREVVQFLAAKTGEEQR